MCKPKLVAPPLVLLLPDYWPLNRESLPATGAVISPAAVLLLAVALWRWPRLQLQAG